MPRWYGEAIGFWDEDNLITWTSNIQGWTAHGAFEFSSQMQAIEIYASSRDEDGSFDRVRFGVVTLDDVAFREAASFANKKNDGCAPTVPTLEGGGRCVQHWAQPSIPIEQVPCQSVTANGTH